MPDTATYYAILLGDRTVEVPSGLARRRRAQDGSTYDEALTREFTWKSNPGLAGWERGDLTAEYVEISEEEANRIVEQFRAKWAGEG